MVLQLNPWEKNHNHFPFGLSISPDYLVLPRALNGQITQSNVFIGLIYLLNACLGELDKVIKT